jgi:ubiquitin-like 1-activating enzyme E1 A
MQNSKVLYLHVTGITAEVLKNLVLAGIAATLCDSRPASALATSSPHFFTPKSVVDSTTTIAHAVQPLIEELNPLLGTCPILEKSIAQLTVEDLKGFSVIMASQVPLPEALRLSELAQSLQIPFYLGDAFGWMAAAIVDLGKTFEYRPEQGKQFLDPQPLKDYVSFGDIIQKTPLHLAVNRFHKTAPPLVWILYRCLLDYQAKTGEWPGDDDTEFDKSIVQSFLQAQQVSLTDEQIETLGHAGLAQVAPVCAVLGGMLGNEIIKVISGKGEPANNTLLLDGNTCKAFSFLVKAKE